MSQRKSLHERKRYAIAFGESFGVRVLPRFQRMQDIPEDDYLDFAGNQFPAKTFKMSVREGSVPPGLVVEIGGELFDVIGRYQKFGSLAKRSA